MKNFELLTKTEKAIRISWAVNNATLLMANKIYVDAKQTKEALDDKVNFFLDYFDNKLEQLEKENELALKVARDKQIARNAVSADKRELKGKAMWDAELDA